MLETVAHQVELIAQFIDAERRVGRRACKFGDLLRPVLLFRSRPPESVSFVQEVESFAIGGDQPIEQALALGGRQLFGIRRAATLDPPCFLLALRFGQMLFGLNSGSTATGAVAGLVGAGLGLAGNRLPSCA
ncbi:MAG: hypothetical protein HT580_17080 [Dechloromonas sp.]|nr:MAG: hypothetical protein HT580_17080 [Dechloromonas sp.]